MGEMNHVRMQVPVPRCQVPVDRESRPAIINEALKVGTGDRKLATGTLAPPVIL